MNRNNIILSYVLDKKGNIQSYRINKIKEKYPNIYNYLENYFLDSSSIKETINRIKYNIYIRPTCKYCGSSVKWYNKDIYAKHCSVKCSSLDKDVQEKGKRTTLYKYGDENYRNFNKYKETCLLKYGVENPMSNEEIKRKSHATLKNKYGSIFNWKKIKETNIKKYGVENVFSNKDIIEKIKHTKYILYNDENYNNREKYKQTCLEKYGVDCSSKNKEIREKISKSHLNTEYQEKVLKTYIKNNSFKKSKPENDCYELLNKKYHNIIRQYKSKEYPFKADFYIPSIDTYIEYNGSHFHHFHPFDKNNLDDIKELESLKEKLKKAKIRLENKESQYDKIIYVWTDLDIRKRNIAKENNLNFLEFYNYDEFLNWYENN